MSTKPCRKPEPAGLSRGLGDVRSSQMDDTYSQRSILTRGEDGVKETLGEVLANLGLGQSVWLNMLASNPIGKPLAELPLRAGSTR